MGELLALLEVEHAQIDASGEDLVKISLADSIWMIVGIELSGLTKALLALTTTFTFSAVLPHLGYS